MRANTSTPAPNQGQSVIGWTVAVVALSIAAWVSAMLFMADMDQGPGTPLHNLPIFLVGWVIMLTAMMLPSELNYIGAFAAMLRARVGKPIVRLRNMTSFIAGYAFAWIAYGMVAYALDTAVRAMSPEIIAWDRAGRYLAGSVLIFAGLFQISGLKHSCLKGCRTPISFFAHYWRKGDLGAVSMGFRHGLVCVGCCWALMGVMFAVGAMSLTWMALLTVFMFAEKMLPNGRKLTLPIAGFLWIMGSWIVVSPSTAPLLKDPLIFHSICHAM